MNRSQLLDMADKVYKRIDNALNAYDIVTEYKGLSEVEALEKAALLMQNLNLVVIAREWDNSFRVSGILDI